MKSLFKNLSILSFLFFSVALSAQGPYTIKSNMKMEGLPAEYAAAAEQEMVTYIKGAKQKTEMSGMMGSAIIFYDGKKMTSLTDQMGQKKGFTATKEEMEADDKASKAPAPKIVYTTDKKTIAGYECTKAIITGKTKDNKEEVTTVWFTEKIKMDPTANSKGSRGMFQLGDLKGYPLSMENSQNMQGMEIKTIIEASEVLTSDIDESVFTVNSEGYTMMSYKEMKALQNASMGK